MTNRGHYITLLLVYRRLSKIRPWVMNLSGCSKREVGIFSRTLSPEIRPTQVLKNPDITDL